MSFKLVGGWPEEDVENGVVTAGTAITKGKLLVVNGNVLAEADANATIHTIWGVADETIGTSAASIKYIPIIAGQTWEADTTNNSATTQRYENCIIGANGGLVNNTDTTVTGPTGVFTIKEVRGAAADKKVLGQFNRLNVTST